jgi:XTP/dITP diphosphohydrolase
LLVYAATKNRGKLAELRAIFASSAIEVATYDAYADVAEGETSFEGNALLKARALHEQLQRNGIEAAVLADDSGLEVEALGGRPGVLSARYVGENASWTQRRQALLTEMRDIPDDQRRARFVCVIVLIAPGGETHSGRGIVEGHLAREERGAGGFGYDPIFIPEGESQTFAEMPEEKKNSMSHRYRGAQALLGTC